jgi:YD repeat-containing protein
VTNLDRLVARVTPQGTLNPTYDAAGDVASMAFRNANGVSVSTPYDNLSSVADNRVPVGQYTTTFSYDPASNLAAATYLTGLTSSCTYDDFNRLT